MPPLPGARASRRAVFAGETHELSGEWHALHVGRQRSVRVQVLDKLGDSGPEREGPGVRVAMGVQRDLRWRGFPATMTIGLLRPGFRL
jgi:hypothetical protein